MALSTYSSGNTVQVWRKKFWQEYVRSNRYAKWMGMTEMSPIQLVKDLTKKKGESVTISLVTRLTGNGVTGSGTLEGNEESLSNYSDSISVTTRRNAVAVDEDEAQKGEIELLDAAKPALKKWIMEKTRTDVDTALLSPNLDGSTAYASTAEADKDAWLDENTDRVLFGSEVGNLDQTAPAGGATNDHSGSLANIDNSNDKMTGALLSLAKRRAQQASPAIQPITVNDDEEWFVVWMDPLAFRDFKDDSAVQQANRDAWTRGKDNPLFRGGDLLWDGCVVREMPHYTTLSGVGAGGIDVAASFLVGAQAIGIGYAQMTKEIKDVRDYGFVNGVGVSEIVGTKKCMFNNKQHGVFTIYTAGVADA